MNKFRLMAIIMLALTCCWRGDGRAEETREKSLPVFSSGLSDFKPLGTNCPKEETWGVQQAVSDSLAASMKPQRGVWQLGKEWSVDEKTGKDDLFSLLVTHASRATSQASVLLPLFDQYDEFIFPEYDLSLDLKTEGASGEIIVEIKTEEPEKKQSVYKIPLKGTQDWQHFSYVTQTPCRMWKFSLILRFEGMGKVWIDNVYLRAVSLAPKDPKNGLEKVMDINDGWKFMLDPDNTGKQKGFLKPGLDVSGWKDISIVTSWDGQGYKTYNGYGWYRNNNVVIPEWVKGDKLFLYFGGVDEVGVVWVNGINVGSHIFWELPFALDVSDAIKPGQRNEIVVKVFDSVYGGGIYGGITLMRAQAR